MRPRSHKQTVQADNCIDCHMPLQESKVITFRSGGSQLAQPYRTHRIAVYDVQAPKQQPQNAARVQFTDVAAEAGITFRHENGASAEKHMFETFGSGVGVIDFDNDGWPDLFFANGADLAHGKRSPGNALYRNLGNGKFEDVTAKAGVAGNGMFATGVTVGDYDNDGFLDIYVTGYGGNQLFRNNGDGTFTEVTGKAGVGGSGWSSSAAWIDYDRDGYLDLFVARYVDYDVRNAPYCGYQKEGYRMYCDPQQFDGTPTCCSTTTGTAPSRRCPARPAWRIRRARAWASRSATSMATAGPISSWPTTACAISCTTTKATAPSRTSPTAPASDST